MISNLSFWDREGERRFVGTFFHGTFLFLNLHFLHNVSPAYLIVQKCTQNIFRACIMWGIICDGFQSFNHICIFIFPHLDLNSIWTPFQLIGLDKMESSQNIKFLDWTIIQIGHNIYVVIKQLLNIGVLWSCFSGTIIIWYILCMLFPRILERF